MRAKYPDRGCPQRDSVEREAYAGARSTGARECAERDGAEGLLEAILDRDNRGWLNHYYVADMKRILQGWNEWLRRRFRMYIWKQWKKPKTKAQNLRKLGVPADKAYQWGNTRLGYWRVAGSPILKCSITNEKFALAGYFDFPAQYERLRKLYLCD